MPNRIQDVWQSSNKYKKRHKIKALPHKTSNILCNRNPIFELSKNIDTIQLLSNTICLVFIAT
jgi:hypothetical protein